MSILNTLVDGLGYTSVDVTVRFVEAILATTGQAVLVNVIDLAAVEAPQEFVATNDTFGESGTPEQLMEKYGLNSKAIIEKSIKVIGRK